MQIYLDDEKYKDEIAALERVRAKLGERSGRSTVARLIREADAKMVPSCRHCRAPIGEPHLSTCAVIHHDPKSINVTGDYCDGYVWKSPKRTRKVTK